jgi:hypothetical protein
MQEFVSERPRDKECHGEVQFTQTWPNNTFSPREAERCNVGMFKIHHTLFLLQFKQAPHGRVWENLRMGVDTRWRVLRLSCDEWVVAWNRSPPLN